MEGEVVVVVRGRSLFRFSSSSLLCTGTRMSSGAGMDETPICQCTGCHGCTKWAPYGPGCLERRSKQDRWLLIGNQRCCACAAVRDARADKGKGKGSIGEASVADLQYLVTHLTEQVRDLSARVADLEGAMQDS